jgi:hypothetical protein
MNIKTKYIWKEGLEPPLPFIKMNQRSIMQGCDRHPAGVYRQYISVMRCRDVYLNKSHVTMLEVAAINWQHHLRIKSHMMPICSKGCGVSGRHTEWSTQWSKWVNLPGSGRRAARSSFAIVDSSQVHWNLPEACWSIVTWYRRVWEPPEPQEGSWKLGTRPGRKLCFPD